ncbi:MAG: MFS transporter [Proteobacteria bacterium]|nr:MFS transporter [Pseudomonadota bacterium]
MQTNNWDWLKLIAIGRILSALTFFMYVGSIQQLITVWKLSATEAGLIQTSLVIGFAFALFISSYCSDFYNPNRILSVCLVINFLSSFTFYLIAKDFWSAIFINFFIGFAQGGIYGPSILLVSEKFKSKNKGAAMGVMLGSQSFGYAISLTLSYIITTNYGYKISFLTASLISLVGATFLLTAIYQDFFKKYQFAELNKKFSLNQNRKTKFLITGYTAHAIELFGLWSWLPVFLSVIIINKISITTVTVGIIIGFSIHLSGVFSSIIAGYLSDNLGRKKILVSFSLFSAILSFLIGWTAELDLFLIVIISIFYSFFAIGDSGVLTAALTESTPKYCVGRTVAYRSILGIGFGSVTPAVFGFILDITNNHQPISSQTNWILAFSFLGIAGLIATFCASQFKS